MLYTVFIRFADEMDSFHGFNKEENKWFRKEYYKSFEAGISLNWYWIHQCTVKEYNITDDLIQAFLKYEAWFSQVRL
jgi:hypothetical protein